jgi:hypothetical protein
MDTVFERLFLVSHKEVVTKYRSPVKRCKCTVLGIAVYLLQLGNGYVATVVRERRGGRTTLVAKRAVYFGNCSLLLGALLVPTPSVCFVISSIQRNLVNMKEIPI